MWQKERELINQIKDIGQNRGAIKDRKVVIKD